jgi:hypothetical protein
MTTLALAFPVDRGRRQLALTLGLSILAHLLVLLIPVHPRSDSGAPVPAVLQGPLTVQLGSPEPPAPRAAEAVPPRAAAPARRPAAPMPKPRELTVPRASRAVDPPPPREAEPEPAPAPRPEPAFDMAALIQANRERRRAAEAAAVRGTGPGREPSGEEVAMANLNRNLQTLGRSDGTGGVFTILRMGARTGEFSFNGWRRERGKQWREVIEVDAGSGGDLERAMVRRMISLIREHYTGDFNWESHRLGRVVVLNAAPENNEALEDYLMREFFGTPAARRR